MICELTGMDVSKCFKHDGASAAEACRYDKDRKRNTIYCVSEAVDARVLEVMGHTLLERDTEVARVRSVTDRSA